MAYLTKVYFFLTLHDLHRLSCGGSYQLWAEWLSTVVGPLVKLEGKWGILIFIASILSMKLQGEVTQWSWSKEEILEVRGERRLDCVFVRRRYVIGFKCSSFCSSIWGCGRLNSVAPILHPSPYSHPTLRDFAIFPTRSQVYFPTLDFGLLLVTWVVQ